MDRAMAEVLIAAEEYAGPLCMVTGEYDDRCTCTDCERERAAEEEADRANS